MFSPGRNWEQIRTTICYNDRKVIIAGSHSGVSVGPDGGTHQALEDIALMRVMPRMSVIYPCDALEAMKATIASIDGNSSVYIRLSREKSPVMTTDDSPFEFGKAQLFYGNFGEKSDVGIIATGSLLHKALLVAENLSKEKISVKVLNISTIKPLDTESVINFAKETGAIVTVEEHQIKGGLGGAVAETLSENYPTQIEFIGVKDQFGQSGTSNELLEHYGMGEKDILKAVKKVLSRKK
jgi:transketolase